MAEVSPEIVSSSRVVVDTLDGAESEAGDLIQTAAAGWDFSRATELATLLNASGSVSNRPTVFKSVGHALFDLAAAHVLVETLEALELDYPPPPEDLDGVVVD